MLPKKHLSRGPVATSSPEGPQNSRTDTAWHSAKRLYPVVAFGPSLVPRLEYAGGFPTDMVAVRMMKMDQMTAISIAFTRGSMMAAVVRR